MCVDVRGVGVVGQEFTTNTPRLSVLSTNGVVFAIGSGCGKTVKFRKVGDVVGWQAGAVVDARNVVGRVSVNDGSVLRTLNKPSFVVGSTSVILNVVLLGIEICFQCLVGHGNGTGFVDMAKNVGSKGRGKRWWFDSGC